MRKTYRDLTREDFEQFKREHPEITRANIYLCKSRRYVNAMKQMGIFDELYPHAITLSADLTQEDCEQFKREHPDIKRTYLEAHYRSYRDAMIRLGVIDDLYPTTNKYPNKLTLEHCEQFKKEYPDISRKEIRIHHTAYHKAMRRLGVYDTLYPLKHQTYSDEELIARAGNYKYRRDLEKNEPKILRAIKSRGKEFMAIAFAHMEPIGNRKHRMIYVYEFTDRSAYVGLTYDCERRQKDHLYEDSSAVRRHMERTGLKPVYRKLTEYLPVKEAQRMEGEWVERYRKDGWTILNVVDTGGIGSGERSKDYQRVIELFKQGVLPKKISEYVDYSPSYVSRILIKEGLSHYGMSNVPIEVLDDDGQVIETFPSVKAAGEAWGMCPSNIAKNIKMGWRTRGHYLRHNAEAYRVKYGKEPPAYEKQ